MAEHDGEWAGAPLPVQDLKLVVEPRYPYQGLNGFKFGEDGDPLETAMGEAIKDQFDSNNICLINTWYCRQRDMDVWVWHDGDGRSKVSLLPARRGPAARLGYQLNCLGASQAWDVNAELQAVKTLSKHIGKVAFDYYVLTGTFLETSKRSGVTYLFRKLRPTVALKQDLRGEITILAALCLHPIGYYEDSYAGCMVPTDDVMAHLLMMRGDERQFWAKANHHNPDHASSGI